MIKFFATNKTVRACDAIATDMPGRYLAKNIGCDDPTTSATPDEDRGRQSSFHLTDCDCISEVVQEKMDHVFSLAILTDVVVLVAKDGRDIALSYCNT